jgi:preprotein translocase subunit SecE
MANNEASEQANRAGMDPRRLVVITYLLFFIVFGLFLSNVIAPIMAALNIADPRVFTEDWSLSRILGFVLSGAAFVGAWFNPKLKGLSMDVANELMRVTWPSFEETRVSTFAVVMASIVASIVLFGIDSLAYQLMVDWLPAVWRKLQ